MVLFGLTDAHDVAVVEIGTNTRGEVRTLTEMAQPNIGVLTLIDVEHAEGLGTIDDIEREEGDLLRGLTPSGSAIANADDSRAMRQLGACPVGDKTSYGTQEGADYRIVGRESPGLGVARLSLERPGLGHRETIALDVPLLGVPGALAIAAAVAVADRVQGAPVSPALLAEAFLVHRPGEPGRLRALALADGTVVLDDTYNANPASIRAAIAAAQEIAAQRDARLVLVLGEMRELGGESAAEHDGIGAAIAASGAGTLIAVSGEAARFVEPARAVGIDAEFVPDSDAAFLMVRERVRPGDVVLVKASRGVRAERVVDGLIAQKGRAP